MFKSIRSGDSLPEADNIETATITDKELSKPVKSATMAVEGKPELISKPKGIETSPLPSVSSKKLLVKENLKDLAHRMMMSIPLRTVSKSMTHKAYSDEIGRASCRERV